MAVTQHDVARRAGVSTAIVSYVINNGPRAVAPETQDRVLAAIQELGYQPSAVARSLRLQRTSTIGVMVPCLDIILTDVVQGMQQIANRYEHRMVLCNTLHDPVQEHKSAEALISERVAGVIWIPASADLSVGRKMSEYHIPLVLVDPPAATPDFVSVEFDNYQGGYLATQHLIALGHRKIALIDRAEEAAFSRERRRGYLAALADYHIPFDPTLLIQTGPQFEDGRDAARVLFARTMPPTAIFAYADIVALGVLRAAYEQKIVIPDQLSLIGFDDISHAAFTCPALTTIAVPKAERGQKSAELLFGLIQQRTDGLSERLAVQLRVRETTGPVPR